MTPAAVAAALGSERFCRLPAPSMTALVGPEALTDWQGFADSWQYLEIDRHMGDGGRYRRRRFACFESRGDGVVRLPHQPHYQGADYNRLNGGIDRWFAPVVDHIAEHPLLRRLLGVCHEAFALAAGTPPCAAAWRVEMHQFRIEADARTLGLPTPEGTHRDGVDWVLVMLVARSNVAGGVTAITGPDRQPLGSFALEHRLDSVCLNDREVWHGVTPLTPEVPDRPAYRDVLVLTYRGVE